MRSGRARHERALRAIRQQQAGLHKSRAERGNRCRLGLDADFGKGCLEVGEHLTPKCVVSLSSSDESVEALSQKRKFLCCLRPAAGHGRKCRKEPCDLFFSWTRLVGFVHID
jgi:hypothetical protein